MNFRLLHFFGVIVFIMFAAAGCANQSHSRYDAIVSASASEAKNSFTSIQAALEAAPNNVTKPYRIFIHAGDYYEKIIIAKPNIHLIGASKSNTRLYYDAYAGQQATFAGATKGQIWGTSGSATLTVRTTGVLLQQLTVENSFDFLRNDALEPGATERVGNTQAVALFLDIGSDQFIAREVNLLGYQDTLYVNSGRSWFDKSFIAGNVDFIFGRGNALFTNSEIHTAARGQPSDPHGYLVAPSTQITNEFGLTFIDCKLTRAKSVPDNSVPLGRPWHPTTQFADGRYADPNAIGKAVFINSWMDAHITTDGWYSMSGTAKDGSKIHFLPEDSRFFEFNSSGPGAVINSKRRQLSDAEAKQYTREKILGDWQPE